MKYAVKMGSHTSIHVYIFKKIGSGSGLKCILIIDYRWCPLTGAGNLENIGIIFVLCIRLCKLPKMN
jgi:hypothetical protein